MKKHESLEALVSNEDTFVLKREHLHGALTFIHEMFHDEYNREDLTGRRAIAGACLTFAMELPYDEARNLFENDQELHRIIDLVVAGYDAYLVFTAQQS